MSYHHREGHRDRDSYHGSDSYRKDRGYHDRGRYEPYSKDYDNHRGEFRRHNSESFRNSDGRGRYSDTHRSYDSPRPPRDRDYVNKYDKYDSRDSRYNDVQLSRSSVIPRRFVDLENPEKLSASQGSTPKKTTIPPSSNFLPVYSALLSMSGLHEHKDELRASVEKIIELWQSIEKAEEQLQCKQNDRLNIKRKLIENGNRAIKRYWEYQQVDRKCRLVEGDLTATIQQVEELQKEGGDWPDVSWELPLFLDTIETEISYSGDVNDVYDI